MAVSQSGRSMSPFTTCWSTGGLSLGTFPHPTPGPATQAQPPLGRLHLVDQPVSRHDHQRVPASQVLGAHQLPGVVPPLCAEGVAIKVGGWSRGFPGWGCSPRPLRGRHSPVSISVKETSAWASSGCTWLQKSCRALPLPPRGFNSTSTWQGLGSRFREPPAVNTNRNPPLGAEDHNAGTRVETRGLKSTGI